MLEKWKRAAVHLECAADSEDIHDHLRRVDESLRRRGQGQPLTANELEDVMRGMRDIRFHGTAIFIEEEGRRYLLSARHVLFDETKQKREVQAEQKWVGHECALERAAEEASDAIFNIIFRVPTLDDVLASRRSEQFLMNLGAGVPSLAPYTFSEEHDLAVVSLDRRDSAFADELVARGHEPLSLDDLADGPREEGQELCAIGFPSATALVGQVDLHWALRSWGSSHFSLPVLSFGRVSMLHDELPFFWADMSIYPGNSGGLVIADDRLIGIVSAQAIVPLDAAPEVYARIPFGKIIKAGHARALLRVQKEKDARFREMTAR